MHLLGKLLSTLAVTLLLLCNAMSTATAAETLIPHLRSSVGGRSEEDGRSLRALDSTRESSEPDEARFLGRIFSFLGNMKSSSRSSSILKSVVLKPPKLSKEQSKKLQLQNNLLAAGNIKPVKDFDAWLAKFANQEDHLVYPVFDKWHKNKVGPGKLTRKLDEIGKYRDDNANEVIARYIYYSRVFPG